MVTSTAKSFAAGLVVAGLVAATVWLVLRQATNRLKRESIAVSSVALSPPPPRTMPTALDATARAESLWRGVGPDDSLTFRHWAAFDAVLDADVPDWARRLPPGTAPFLSRLILQRWASLDGASAMAWLESHGRATGTTATSSDTDLADSLLTCWIASDPAGGASGLRRHLQTLPPESRMPVSALETLAGRDFAGTLEAVAASWAPDSATPRRSLPSLGATSRILAIQARGSPYRETLKAWLHGHPDPGIRGNIFSWIYRHFDPTQGGPARIRDYLPGADRLPDDVRHPDAIWAVLPYTESTDPVAAFSAHRQIMEKADSSARNHLVQAMRSWAGTDPESAGLWLAAQAPSPLIDQARRAYAELIVEEDPAAALAWAGTIGDPAWRSLICGNLYRRWRTRNPSAAEAWLAVAPLSQTQRQYVAGRALLH